MQPSLMNTEMSFHEFSNFSRSVLYSPVSLSATFLVMCLEIFCTCLSFCKKLRETFRGISGQSMTPLSSIRYSGMTSLMLSAMNTWLQYSLTLPRSSSTLLFTLGKYRMPLRRKG